MTSVGESRKEAQRPTVSFVTPKQGVRLGCWNVRSLYRTGAAAQVAREMERYELDALGVSECRWTGAGKMKVATGETILYSGRENEHEGGVAIVLKRKALDALMEWTPVSDRIITARLYSKFRKITIVQVYAPHNEREEGEKDQFYEDLQETIDKINKNDIVIIMGDLNAKIGKNNNGFESVMGVNGLGNMNNNGERLCEFCQMNRMVVTGSIFPHKDIHKATWVSPDGVTRNQIDHVIIGSKWRSSVMDTRAKRGADINSDHYLVISRLRLKLAVHRNNKAIKRRFETERLRDDGTKKHYIETLRGKMTRARNEREDNVNIDEIWEGQRMAFVETAEQVLGYRKGISKPWIGAESWHKIDQRREIKTRIESTKSERVRNRIREIYKEKDREVKKSIREDKRKWMEEKAERAQGAAENGRQKELYELTKQISGNNFRKTAAVKSKTGVVLKSKEDRLNRWKQHFEEVLNREQIHEPITEEEAEGEELDIPTEPPTQAEIRKALRHMRNGKSPGVDQISPEMLKTDEETTVEEMKYIFDLVWEKERTPVQWSQGLICKIPKKGNLQECGNWRGVTLLPLTSKVLSKIIINRIQRGVDDKIRKEQAGFRPGRGTTEHIFVLRNILEQANEWNATMYIHFVDFEKAFDTVHRESLWLLMKKYGIPPKLISMVRALYEGFQCAVIEDGETTEWFPVISGVKQGCCMSGFLFLLVIDWIVNKATEGNSTGIRWHFTDKLEDLEFADDIALISSKFEHIQAKTTKLEQYANRTGLKLNAHKCKLMKVNSKREERLKIIGGDIDEVETFTYLGAEMCKDGGGAADIRKRIGLASGAFHKLRKVWNTQNIGRKTKTTLYKTLVLSVLMYGSETWKLTKEEERKIDTFQSKCLRRIMRIRWQMRVKNERVLELAEAERVSVIVKRKRWNWIGHVLRKGEGNDCAVALGWTPEGKRARGRPKTTWRKMVEKERKTAGWRSWQHARTVAKDRRKWKENVQDLCASWR